jgi:predicted dehydrogenase
MNEKRIIVREGSGSNGLGRRAFLGRTLAAGAAWGFPSIGVAGVNEEIRLAVVGLNGKGSHHIEMFGKLPGVRIVALCDVDQNVLKRTAEKYFKGKVGQHVDYREVLDRKDVDAVCLATPNHWHALGAVWACDAGKDVYLEKPISHNLWEGRQIMAAAERSGRIVATGTQSRSAPGTREFVADVRAGIYGPVKLARGFCYKERGSIGKASGPQAPPPQVDYHLWSGPREPAPVMRKRFHYDWHWQWAYGNGDLGNQGPHQMDLCAWILGVEALAPRVVSLGGRFGYDDDGETPNTQTVLFDYPDAPLVFEVRGLPDAADSSRMSDYRGGRVSAVIEFEGGYFVGTNGGVFFDNEGKRVKAYSGGLSTEHHVNFINALRSRRASELNAGPLQGHLSSALCHMGNISQRLGSAISNEQLQEQCNTEGLRGEVFGRLLKHALVHETDFTNRKMTLGPSLEFDPKSERFTGPLADHANALIKGDYREGFSIPELARVEPVPRGQ